MISIFKTPQLATQKLIAKASIFSLVALAHASANAAESGVVSKVGSWFFCLMTGELAVWIFVGIVAAALLIGLLGKVDFSTIVKAVVIIGIIQMLATLLPTMFNSTITITCTTTRV